MEQLTSTQFLWVTIIVGGIVGIIVLTRTPELLVALLIVGQDFIQFALKLLGFTVTRREFATAGAIIFLPAVLLFLMVRMVQTREREPIIGRPNLSFVATAVVMGIVFLIGLTYTLASHYGSQKTGEYFIFGMAPMFLTFVFIQDHAAVRRLIWWIILVSTAMVILVSAYSLATRGTIETLLMFSPEEGGWAGMEIWGHGSLSGAVVIIFASFLGLAAGRQGAIWKAIPLIILPIACFYIIHAGTRSNLLAFLFVATVGFYLAFKGKRAMFVAGLLVFAIAGAVFMMLAAPEIQERMFSSWVAEDSPHGTGGAIRLRILGEMPAQFAQAPILGQGTGGWVILEHGMDVYDYPHNMVVEILVENGLVGFAVFLVLWYLVLRRIWRSLRDEEVGSELYGIGVFGVCLMAMEFFTGVAHFGLAHHSCTLLISSAIILRMTFLVEEARAFQERAEPEPGMLIRPALRAGPV